MASCKAQAFGAGHIQVGFVDRSHLDQRREAVQHLAHAGGAVPVTVGVAVHEGGVRAQARGGAQGHGGMHAEFARFIGRRGHHATLVRAAADHYGLALERWVEQFFDGYEERVHVHVKDGLHRFMSLCTRILRSATVLVGALIEVDAASPPSGHVLSRRQMREKRFG